MKAELEHLTVVDRPEMTRIESWAASNGDRSENGDYLKGTSINSDFRDEVLGATRAATGMYALVHEDCEHDATTQFARKTDL